MYFPEGQYGVVVVVVDGGMVVDVDVVEVDVDVEVVLEVDVDVEVGFESIGMFPFVPTAVSSQ
jgi:hypothetical protein